MGGCASKSRSKDDDSKFNEDVLTSHNKYRKKHGSPALKLSKDLCEYAQEWADQLASKRSFEHRPNASFQGKMVGENLASKCSSDGSADYAGEEVAQYWYDEISKYAWDNKYTSGTGHFTQVIWKESLHLGVGKARDADGRVIVVCNYSPAGNVQGKYEENVVKAR